MASYNQDINTPINTLEYQKFVALGGSEYPAITSVRTTTLDNGSTYSLSSVFSKTAVLTYLTNASDISVSLSADNINVNLADVETLLNAVTAKLDQQLGQAGVVAIDGTSSAFGTFTTFQTLTTTRIAAITATNSSGTSVITNHELLQGYSFSAPIKGITLSYGAALLYK
jgi:hypothetical protein